MPFITCTFLNTWSDSSGFSAACWAFTAATPARHATSAATATVVLVAPRLMLAPHSKADLTVGLYDSGGRLKNEGPRRRGPGMPKRRVRPRLLGGRRRLAEVRGPIDLLAGIGHRDLRALREVHVRIAALDDAPDQRDRHARLHRGGAPAELLDQLL